jgi:HEAT repeat protein
MPKKKINFKESLTKIQEIEDTFSTSAVVAFSNMEPEDQAQFEAVWLKLPPGQRQRIVTTMLDLAEDDVKLDFTAVLFFILGDLDPGVRKTAIEGLWEDDSREFLAKLLTLLSDDPDESVREKAALGLSRFAYLAEMNELLPRWIERLHNALLAQAAPENRSISVRRRSLEALGYFGEDERTLRLIEKAYTSDDELLKASAVRAMGRSVNKRWLPEVGKELSSPDPALRYEAATAAGELGFDELVPPIIALVDDEDREVQLAAIWALGQIGGPEAKRYLSQLCDSEDETIVNAATDALAEITYADNPLNVLSNS